MELNLKKISLFVFILMMVLFKENHASSQEIKRTITANKTLYVATNGNDLWSGTLPAPDSSGNDGPFATLQRARNAIRDLRQKSSNDAFTVLVRGGVYQLNETFVLGPEDSGTVSQPLIIRAFDNEHPILTGTRIINNFERYKGKIQKANLEGIDHNLDQLRQIFVNGKRQILARYPDFDPLNPIGGGFLYVDKPVTERSKLEFKSQNGALPEWTDLYGAELVIFPGANYTNSIIPILNIDRKIQSVTLSKDCPYDIISGNRYYFQNFLEALDSPGEWYFDRRSKVLFFWPPANLTKNAVTIPVLKSIIEIKGRKYGKHYATPSNIRFEGFTLEGCQGSAIVVNGAKKTELAGNTIYNAGNFGIEIQEGFENIAIGNDIYEVGNTGISISGGDLKTLAPARNRAENNFIHNTGVINKGGASGILCKGVGNVVSHNLIHSTPRVGIWLEGNDHLIEFNHVHHVNQETRDSGIIYSSQIDWTKRGNVIQFNYLHDSGGYELDRATGKWQTPFDTYGIYMDDWTSGTKVYGNIVANTTSGGIFIHGGRDNIVENNVIIEGGRLGQMVYSGWPVTSPTAQKWLPKMYSKVRETGYEKYPLLSTIRDEKTGATMSGNSFERNIVCYSSPNASLYGIFNDIDLATTKSDYNIIFHSNLPLLVPFTKAPAAQQWMFWQNKGMDRSSLIADPQFSDVTNGNFTLSPASPALKMGFKQIPFDKIGPYKDPRRASWPIKETN